DREAGRKLGGRLLCHRRDLTGALQFMAVVRAERDDRQRQHALAPTVSLDRDLVVALKGLYRLAQGVGTAVDKWPFGSLDHRDHVVPRDRPAGFERVR